MVLVREAALTVALAPRSVAGGSGFVSIDHVGKIGWSGNPW